ncbi:hypothetical protein OsI_11740 [Oryza sativa Indica Group]|uniref:Uncharacterized protein n=1 Tax=Oryza sativa subsp. indica TaxID=39946 RepID=A2XH65_ORYSI|nr:hypothetical protein OsI_11740 [Oryza sativa Indica Group]
MTIQKKQNCGKNNEKAVKRKAPSLDSGSNEGNTSAEEQNNNSTGVKKGYKLLNADATSHGRHTTAGCPILDYGVGVLASTATSNAAGAHLRHSTWRRRHSMASRNIVRREQWQQQLLRCEHDEPEYSSVHHNPAFRRYSYEGRHAIPSFPIDWP